MKRIITLLIIAAALLSACSGSVSGRPSHVQQHSHTVHAVTLPISAGQWRHWQCSQGEQLQTRYSDAQGQTLELITGDGRYRLTREPSINPVIYSNDLIAFYSDGQYAAIGRPLSDVVISGGCVPL